MHDVEEILLHAGSGTEALRRLLDWSRQNNPKWSYAWIAKQLGLSSKGHIADLLSGRRVLVPRLWQPCLDLLNLHGIPLKYLQALLNSEERLLREKDVSPEDYQRLESLRKILRGQLNRYSERIVSNHMILQVHAVFGLYQNQPTRRQLIQFFGRQHMLEVDRALQVLLAEGLVERQVDRYHLKPEAQHVMVLGPEPQKQQIVEYLQQGLEQSKKAVERWSDHRDVACFRSAHISVKREAYVRYLDTLRDELLRLQNEMSSTDGDMLIRIDLQVYPIGSKQDEDLLPLG